MSNRDELKPGAVVSMRDPIEALEQRVTNLEAVLHVLWAILRETQPLSVQDDVTHMLEKHYDAAVELGGCRRGSFDVEG